ncbi:MAG: hypothetical protein VX899_23655 [Myxococcota bacterium]|nr:hypothetical protein [Myxococcota bacterium]
MDQLLMPLGLLAHLLGPVVAQDTETPPPTSEDTPAPTEPEAAESDAAEEDLEADDWTPDQAKAPPPELPWRSLSAGGTLGLAIPRSGLEAGPALALEARWRPEALQGRVQPTLALSRASVSTSGTLEDDAFSTAYRWSLSQAQLALQPGVTLRVLAPAERAQPELRLAPSLVRTRSTLQGQLEGQTPPVRETLWSVGWVASPGLAVALPAGELMMHLEVQRVSQAGALTGAAPGLQLSPTLGYQQLF